MWPWQQKGRNKRQILLNIFCITAAAHLVVLFNLFFIYNKSEHSFIFKAGDLARLDQAKIVVMPFGKKRKNVQKMPVLTAQKKTADPVALPIAEKKEMPSPSVVQKEVAKATTTMAAQTMPKPKKKKKQLLKKQKNNIRKQKKLKKEAVRKQDKKVLQQLPIQESKKIVKEQVQKPKDEQPVKSNESTLPVVEAAATSEPVYVTQQELEELLLYDDLKAELESVWKPPIGISDARCQMRIALSWEGAVEQTIIETSSGVLVFDMAARQAVSAMKFPKQLWGKQLSITFT